MVEQSNFTTESPTKQNEEEYFECVYCDKVFVTDETLKLHIFDKHDVKPQKPAIRPESLDPDLPTAGVTKVTGENLDKKQNSPMKIEQEREIDSRIPQYKPGFNNGIRENISDNFDNSSFDHNFRLNSNERISTKNHRRESFEANYEKQGSQNNNVSPNDGNSNSANFRSPPKSKEKKNKPRRRPKTNKGAGEGPEITSWQHSRIHPDSKNSAGNPVPFVLPKQEPEDEPNESSDEYQDSFHSNNTNAPSNHMNPFQAKNLMGDTEESSDYDSDEDTTPGGQSGSSALDLARSMFSNNVPNPNQAINMINQLANKLSMPSNSNSSTLSMANIGERTFSDIKVRKPFEDSQTSILAEQMYNRNNPSDNNRNISFDTRYSADRIHTDHDRSPTKRNRREIANFDHSNNDHEQNAMTEMGIPIKSELLHDEYASQNKRETPHDLEPRFSRQNIAGHASNIQRESQRESKNINHIKEEQCNDYSNPLDQSLGENDGTIGEFSKLLDTLASPSRSSSTNSPINIKENRDPALSIRDNNNNEERYSQERNYDNVQVIEHNNDENNQMTLPDLPPLPLKECRRFNLSCDFVCLDDEELAKHMNIRHKDNSNNQDNIKSLRPPPVNEGAGIANNFSHAPVNQYVTQDETGRTKYTGTKYTKNTETILLQKKLASFEDKKQQLSCSFQNCYTVVNSQNDLIQHEKTHIGVPPNKSTLHSLNGTSNLISNKQDHNSNNILGNAPRNTLPPSQLQNNRLDYERDLHTKRQEHGFDSPHYNKATSKDSFLSNPHGRSNGALSTNNPFKVTGMSQTFLCDFSNCRESFSRNVDLINHKRSHQRENTTRNPFQSNTLQRPPNDNFSPGLPNSGNFNGMNSMRASPHNINNQRFEKRANDEFNQRKPDYNGQMSKNSHVEQNSFDSKRSRNQSYIAKSNGLGFNSQSDISRFQSSNVASSVHKPNFYNDPMSQNRNSLKPSTTLPSTTKPQQSLESKSYSCNECNYFTPLKYNYDSHMSQYHNNMGNQTQPINRYEEREQRSHIQSGRIDGQRSVSPQGRYLGQRCPEGNCQFIANNKNEYITHVEQVHNNFKPFECRYCGKRFDHREYDAFEQHIKQDHLRVQPR